MLQVILAEPPFLCEATCVKIATEKVTVCRVFLYTCHSGQHISVEIYILTAQALKCYFLPQEICLFHLIKHPDYGKK